MITNLYIFLFFKKFNKINSITKTRLEKLCFITVLLIFIFIFQITSAQNIVEYPSKQVISQNSVDSALVLYEEGYYYYSIGNLTLAEEKFKLALKLEPNLIKAHYWLGKVYQEQGKFKEAISHFDEVKRIKTLIAQRRKALSILDNSYNVDQKLERLSIKIREAEQAYIAYENNLKEGFWNAALANIKKAVDLYPANIVYLASLARILWDLSMFEKSIETYKRILDVISSFGEQISIIKQNEEILLESLNKLIIVGYITDADRYIKKIYSIIPKNLRIHEISEKIKSLQTKHKNQISEISFYNNKIPKILQIKNGLVIINIGFDDGLKLEDEYKLKLLVKRPIESTNQIENSHHLSIQNNAFDILGEILVTKIFSNLSWAIINQEFIKFKEGDIVEFKIN